MSDGLTFAEGATMSTSLGELAAERKGLKSAPMDVARGIGDQLIDAAIVAGDRCTWMGRDPSEMLDPKSPIVPTARSLTADLYGGTAGVGLFLAQLDACLGRDPSRERTARGALATAIQDADRRRGRFGAGLFDGSAGVGHAAVRIGEIYDDAVAVANGLALLERGALEATAAGALDVVSGLAGVVLVLGAHVRNHPGLASALVAAGEALLSRATARETIWRWPSSLGFGGAKHCPTGLSHGAAGIAAALLALYATTDRAEFRQAALGTIRYEDGWFIPEERNWPDLRSFEGDELPAGREDRRTLMCSRTWCHGAPGILLARTLAASVGVSTPERATAAALHTTIAEANNWQAGADVTPCHGATGLVECLLYASRGGAAIPARKARDAAEALLGRVLAAHAGTAWWTSGAPSGGPNPSLMLGMAGVGYHFLRWAQPERVPSILMPFPPSASRAAI